MSGVKRELFECANCGKKWTEDNCHPAKDLLQRLERGAIFTDLECPECGTLCYPIGEERLENDG